jgi:hypothetical protein
MSYCFRLCHKISWRLWGFFNGPNRDHGSSATRLTGRELKCSQWSGDWRDIRKMFCVITRAFVIFYNVLIASIHCAKQACRFRTYCSVPHKLITIFWGVTPCSLVDVYWSCGDICSLQHPHIQWKRQLPLKEWYISKYTRLHGITSQKVTLIGITVRTSEPTF